MYAGNSEGGAEFIGGSGTAIFNQSGGTNNIYGELEVEGGGADYGMLIGGGRGTYNLSAGLLATSTPGSENVGLAGTGTFVQTGGTNTCGSLSLGYSTYSTVVSYPGTYNLNGGLLRVATSIGTGLEANTTYNIFNFTAGTLQAGGALTNSIPITVGTAASNVATVDANGQTMTLNGGGRLFPARASWP